MSEPRKLNTGGARGSRSVRRPEDTQGRMTNTEQFKRAYAPQDLQRSTATRSRSNPDAYYDIPVSERTARRTSSARSTQTGRPAGQGAGRATVRQSGQQARRTAQRMPEGRRPAPRAGRGGAAAKRHPSVLKITVFTILIIFAIFLITVKVVLHAISPGADLSISQLINTPTEYQGDEINILVAGIDWEEGRAYGTNDSNTNDGMTDMILYVHCNIKEGKIYMLQIPRNTLVAGVYDSANYQINAVARGEEGIAGLANCINKMFGLPVDDYVTIDMAALKEVVDTFGGLEVYVPHDMDFDGSHLSQGYQTLDGDAAEFFVRCRKGEGYENSDLDRLNMQRYFYSALFRRLRTMTIWDVAKLTPAAMNYITTSLSAQELISLGVSFLKIDSANMMIAQLPVYFSPDYYNGNSVVVAARQEDADLLNTYFRSYEVPADELNLPEWSVSGEASSSNVQFMGQLDTQAENGQQNENLDGSYTVQTVTTTAAPEDEEQQEEDGQQPAA